MTPTGSLLFFQNIEKHFFLYKDQDTKANLRTVPHTAASSSRVTWYRGKPKSSLGSANTPQSTSDDSLLYDYIRHLT